MRVAFILKLAMTIATQRNSQLFDVFSVMAELVRHAFEGTPGGGSWGRGWAIAFLAGFHRANIASLAAGRVQNASQAAHTLSAIALSFHDQVTLAQLCLFTAHSCFG